MGKSTKSISYSKDGTHILCGLPHKGPMVLHLVAIVSCTCLTMLFVINKKLSLKCTYIMYFVILLLEIIPEFLYRRNEKNDHRNIQL